MPAMDLLVSDSGATGHFGASLSWDTTEVCNNLQNVVAITCIFALQQPTFWVCNFLHFYFTTNTDWFFVSRHFPVIFVQTKKTGQNESNRSNCLYSLTLCIASATSSRNLPDLHMLRIISSHFTDPGYHFEFLRCGYKLCLLQSTPKELFMRKYGFLKVLSVIRAVVYNLSEFFFMSNHGI